MKKLLLLTSALLVLTAAAASAQVNLSWNNCLGVGTAAANKAYACDGTLDGIPQKVVASFICPAGGLTKFVGISGLVDVTADNGAGALPDYWKLGVGECRDGVLVFPAGLTGIGNTTTCRNPWTGHTGGGFQWNSGVPTANRGHLQLAFATDVEIALTGGQHYVAGVFTIDPFGDVDPTTLLPPGPCLGCELPMCMVLNEVGLFQTAGTLPQDTYILNAAATRQYVTWQGGAVPGGGCPAATPTKNATWGSVKALYR